MKNAFKKKAGIFAAAATMMMTAVSPSVYAEEAKEGDTYELSIIYDNDIHGRLDRLPQFKTLIDEAREEAVSYTHLDVYKRQQDYFAE